jgi:diguanylate cyclase (GGDEF)-like protein
MKPSVLVVDDEPSVRSMIVELLRETDYVATSAESGEVALAILEKTRYDVVFTDIRMPGIDGIELLQRIKAKDPTIEVLVLTSHSSFTSAVEALRLGAYDYLIKPLNDIQDVLVIMERVGKKISLAEEAAHAVDTLQAKNREIEESHTQAVQESEDLSALYAAEKKIMAEMDLDELYGRSGEELSLLLNGQPALIWTLSEEVDTQLSPKAQSGFEVFDKIAWTFPVFDATCGSDVPRDWQEKCRQTLQARSAIFHPVISRHNLVALLGVFDFKREAFTPREIDLCARFGTSVAMAIENAQRYAEAKALSIRDGLTGLYNRRHFDNVMTVEGARSIRHQMPVSLLFMDVDHFKHYNDTNGHLMGDGLLKQLAALILKRVRISDVVCRYGGEEITIVIPHTNKTNAVILAGDLRQKIEHYPFLARETQPGGAVTVSIGVAECPTDSTVPVEIVRMADEALYEAKQTGRNRVCAYKKSSTTLVKPALP